MSSHDEWYDIWSLSNVSTSCVVRVTNQCDQKCRHCAFRSGPDQVGKMSVQMCREINSWVPRKILLNIMGGEITVLPDYPELLIALSEGRGHIRMVTNGYLSKNPSKFWDTIRQIRKRSCYKVEVAVSQDQWHEKQSHIAISLLADNEVGATPVETSNIFLEDITPVGRAWDNGLCSNYPTKRKCEIMSNMTITEDGMITRCPFGYFPWKHFSETTWHDAQEYIWGWRSERLSEGMNCHSCMEKDRLETRRLRCELVESV